MNIDPSAVPHFDEAFRARLRDLFCWRRDVRRFRTDPLPPDLLERLIEVACHAPSVGLCQPWRFVVVDDPSRRQGVIDNFEACNRDALGEYTGELSSRYAALKLAGLREAPCHLAVFADRSTAVGHGLGRRTMPEMADYSVVSAVFSIWLAARAEGIGMGWVSILDPLAMSGFWTFRQTGASSDISVSAIRRLKTITRNWSASVGSSVSLREVSFFGDDRISRKRLGDG